MALNWFTAGVKNDLQLPGSPWLNVSDLICKKLAYRIRLEGLTHQQLEKVAQIVGTSFMRKYHLYDLYDSFSPISSKSTRLSKDIDIKKLLKELTLKAASDCDCVLPLSLSSNQDFVQFIDLVKALYREKSARKQPQTSEVDFDSNRYRSGQTILTILKSDPGSLIKVKQRLNGQQLPPNLRSYIFRFMLLNKRKSSSSSSSLISELNYNASTHDKLRSEFGLKVKSNKSEMKINNPIETRLLSLIHSSVEAAFKSNLGFQDYGADGLFPSECCCVLNILYTYRKQFENIYIFWCFPLLLTFANEQYDEERRYEMAMWLNILITEYVPSETAVNQIVFSSWVKALKHSDQVVFKNDLDLGALMQSFGIATDEDSVKSILSDSHKLKSRNRSNDLLHPIVFMRQWVVQLFVGHLKLPCTLYFWDQLFLNNWSPKCFAHVCLVLIYAISDNISSCKNKTDVLESFNQNLNFFSLGDIRKSWKHVNNLL